MKNYTGIYSLLINHRRLYIKQMIVTVLMMIMVSPVAIGSGIYKWTDENGKIHYGSAKPSDADSERMNIKVDTTKRIKKKKKKAQEETEEAEELPIEAPETPKISKKEKARACKDARARLQNIQSHGRLREFDEKGNSVILAEEQRQKRISEAKKRIRENCK
ncbi:MAG: DUF4124 domain-containing protein [Gammaproteobacteria bacterium]|nr:DUF4124 domain-containing protein [Gammaproteobacteria bacterium]MCK5262246.1 DUF4124 domain-containing protein [Gammaproteobacteria bacterium]